MRYESAQKLTKSDFKRSQGVYPETFEAMVKVVKVERMLKKKTGRKDKLTIEDQVLITLAYWREQRTYFHLGQDWQLNESTVYRIIRRVEDILIDCGLFALPGKKVLMSAESEIETIVVDVTEQEVERPQKNRKTIIVANRRNIQ